jgi:hypothetical protein
VKATASPKIAAVTFDVSEGTSLTSHSHTISLTLLLPPTFIPSSISFHRPFQTHTLTSLHSTPRQSPNHLTPTNLLPCVGLHSKFAGGLHITLLSCVHLHTCSQLSVRGACTALPTQPQPPFDLPSAIQFHSTPHPTFPKQSIQHLLSIFHETLNLC